MATVLSGISGAFYYKPAGTLSTFGTADVSIGFTGSVADVGVDPQDTLDTAFPSAVSGNGVIDLATGDLWVYDGTDWNNTGEPVPGNSFNLGPSFNFKPGDSVRFLIRNTQTEAVGVGTLPGGITANTTYYIVGYNNLTGIATVSASPTLSPVVTITTVGALAAPNRFEVSYASFAVVAEVRDWSLEISRAEIDVTTIGKTLGQYVPFRSYISGFGDANGSANVYMTDEDQALANRMVQDVLLRKQVGASVKLYIERIESGGNVNEAKSRSVEMDVTLTSASLSVNPDDAQSVAINFRPSDTVSFDFATS